MTANNRIERLFDWAQPVKYRLLLVSLLLLSVLSHAASDSFIAKVLHVALLQVALLTCIVAVRKYQRLFWIAVGLGVLAFGDSSREYLNEDRHIHLSALLISSLFFVILAITFLYDVLKSTSIGPDDICGALCVYVMIGVIWSYFYAVTLIFNPQALALPEIQPVEAHLSGTLTYFSFVTLTTLGYGDIQPVTPLARTLCWLEAMIGQIFMTVLIARLVGLNLTHHQSKRDETE